MGKDEKMLMLTEFRPLSQQGCPFSDEAQQVSPHLLLSLYSAVRVL